MRTTRKLELRRERLAELTTDELDAIAGGDATLTTCIVSRAIDPCTVQTITCFSCTCTVSRIIDPCLTVTCVC